MKEKYRDYLKLNKSFLVAIISSIIISALAAQLLVDQEDYLNTTFTLIVDYTVYFSVFFTMYYFDNRKKYLLESGKKDNQAFRKDLIKIISSLGIAEIVYTIARWLLQYYFLTIEYDPYLASIISQVISASICLLVLNLSVKMTRLYKYGN